MKIALQQEVSLKKIKDEGTSRRKRGRNIRSLRDENEHGGKVISEI